MVNFRVYALIRKYFHCNFERIFEPLINIFVFMPVCIFFAEKTKRALVDQAYSCCSSPVLLFCWSSFVILMQLFVFLFTTSYLLTDLQCHDCKAVSRHCWLNCFEGQWSRERSTTSNFSKSFLREIFMLISLIMKHYIFLQSSIRINEIANFNPNIKTAIKRKMGQFQRGN